MWWQPRSSQACSPILEHGHFLWAGKKVRIHSHVAISNYSLVKIFKRTHTWCLLTFFLRTALEVAASLQDSATLEVLMSEKGLELSETCRISALCNAVTVGSLGNFKLLFGNTQSESASLLSAPVDYVLIPEKARQGTLLHAVVALVLQQNRDIWPSLGNTADLAHRRLSILQWFLTKADSIVNATDSAGRNALHIVAAGLHRIEPWSRQLYARGVVNLLLAKKDLNVNAVDAKGSTALHIAAKRRHSTVVASLLSSRELSVNAKNRTGDTALHLASRRLRQYNESIGFVIIELATARTGDDSESAYEVAHWLLMDERVDEVATNADGVTARELAGDNDWTADLFQMHGRHCRSAYGTRTLHFTARSHRNLRNCEIKYTRKR